MAYSAKRNQLWLSSEHPVTPMRQTSSVLVIANRLLDAQRSLAPSASRSDIYNPFRYLYLGASTGAGPRKWLVLKSSR